MRRGAGSAVRLATWTAGAALAVVVLGGIDGPLSPPPLSHPGRLAEWAGRREPAEAAFAVVRLLTLALAWYLLAAATVGTAARALRLGLLTGAVDRLTVPALRRLLNGAMGVTMTFTTCTATMGTATAEPPPSAAAEVLRRLPDGPGTAPTTTVPPGTAPTAPTSPPEAAPPATWEVQPGDHLWSVAEKVLSRAWGRASSDGETAPYWRVLVEANRAVLRDPGNADLVFPHQVLTVPTPPPAPPG